MREGRRSGIGDFEMIYYWRIRKWLPERYGQRCRVLKWGRLNNCLVEFEDGFRVISSRYSVRLLHSKESRA